MGQASSNDDLNTENETDYGIGRHKKLEYDDFSYTRVTPRPQGHRKLKNFQIDPLELGLLIDYFFTQLFDVVPFVVYFSQWNKFLLI